MIQATKRGKKRSAPTFWKEKNPALGTNVTENGTVRGQTMKRSNKKGSASTLCTKKSLDAGTNVTENGNRSFTRVQPSHYTLKIESFSSLLDSQLERYETYCFEAGGYKWRLVLYPDGTKKADSQGYISLFLALAEHDDVSLGLQVNVIANFFLFDQLRDRYLVIQDDEMTEWRFHKMKTEWGLTKLVSKDAFNDPSNGYLVNDCCIFGVEVSVIKSSQKGESLSLVKQPKGGLYTWKFDNYSAMDGNFYYSDEFIVEGNKWKLVLSPTGDTGDKGKHLSLYLMLNYSKTIPPKRKFFAKYTLRLKDQISNNHLEKTVQNWFDGPGNDWGFLEFVLLPDLKNTSNGYLVNDSIVCEVNFHFVSSAKDFS